MGSDAKPTVRTMDAAYRQLLEADTHAAHISDALRRDAPLPPGPSLVPVARYVSRDAHEMEKQQLWSRCWQMAAHEDDFPNVGDVVPYDITTMSFIVVRVADDEYKAYYNACLHRGRKLREDRARALRELRCPFHGWAWHLDGRLKQVPCSYDYAGLDRDAESLPEVSVARWGRYIFINPDPDCQPFEEFIGDLDSNFPLLPYTRRYKSAHVAKVMRANWKVIQEAFMESYHVLMTHPEILTGGANDMCTKYDAFGNYSRAIRTGALEAESMPDWESLPEDGVLRFRDPLNGWVYEDLGEGRVKVVDRKGVEGVFDAHGRWLEGELTDANPHLCLWVGGCQVAEEDSAAYLRDPAMLEKLREKLGDEAPMSAMVGELQRMRLKQIIPSIADTIPDVELHASIFFTLFPNFHPWGSFNQINYRFRPNGDNHEECIMECIFLAPIPEDGDYEPASEIHWLEPDDDWTAAPELGGLAKIFNQDQRNLPFVYEGLKATAREHVRFADYNELKLRHWHQLYEQWVAD
jgi:nitrite reductase/ring-hydroxylating ferredoxin subunit